jgi:CysZ protein
MGFFDGITTNLNGLRWAVKSPKLMALGLARFFAMLLLAVICVILVMAYRQEATSLLWSKPQSTWLVFIWQALSWFVSLFLLGLSAILSYLIAQILFSVVIMDIMSRATEKLATGEVASAYQGSMWRQLIHLVTQEAPRALFPVLIVLLLTFLGLLTPLGPLFAILSPLVTVVFLAWDNTDLVPARRMVPFKERFRFLLKTLPFHLGFGLWFLIPVLNLLFLSFAPVGGTLYRVTTGTAKAPEIS